jgi:hypothetical protein
MVIDLFDDLIVKNLLTILPLTVFELAVERLIFFSEDIVSFKP